MRSRVTLPLALVVIALALPVSAVAAVTPAVTTQAAEANAAFLAYAPAPTGPAGALCIVDTGVNANPDTTPGLIGSYALDSGPTGDADPKGHGTVEAMIAGAAGEGMVGAWPQIKIVSIRETTDPGAGQEPQYQFANYYQGMNYCEQAAGQDHTKAVLLALNSTIPGSPDQTNLFQQTVARLEQQDGIAVVASAGNDDGGAIEEPASEAGVFAVGASTAQPGTLSDTAIGTSCSFSATQSVDFYAPGCGLDEADPFTDQPFCCGDGTSQAAAFTAAVIVALMSYDPTVTYAKAESLLAQTNTNGDLNVAAAFQADGLGSIVTQGNANTPQPPATGPSGATGPTDRTGATGTTSGATSPTSVAGATGATGTSGKRGTSSTKPKAPHSRPRIRITSIRWSQTFRSLAITITGAPTGARTRLTLTYAHGEPKTVTETGPRIALTTSKPTTVTLRIYGPGKHGKALGPPITRTL